MPAILNIQSDARPIKSISTQHRDFVAGTTEQLQRISGNKKVYGTTSIVAYLEADGQLWVAALVDDEVIFRTAASNAEIEYELSPEKYVDTRKVDEIRG